MEALIGVLAGDGIGPEVMRPAVQTLQAIGDAAGHRFQVEQALFGGAALDATGNAFPETTRKLAADSNAVLLGAVGGPQWSAPGQADLPVQALLDLRAAMQVYANLRPVKTHPILYSASPLRPEYLENVDILVVRELTGGIYFGEKTRDANKATDTCTYERHEIERIIRMAADFANDRRGKVTSVDKANVLETSRLWRGIAEEMFSGEFSNIELEHLLIDAAAMHLLSRPADFDVIVTENMFGDILTDEASMLCGSLGMLPSAALNEERRGLYEPIHGSAPDIAGRNIANPCGMILSVALMLRYSLGLDDEATLIEQAVYRALESGHRTADIAGPDDPPVGTTELGDAIVAELAAAAG
jgi:3-isopropylmalate dehydrogenase